MVGTRVKDFLRDTNHDSKLSYYNWPCIDKNDLHCYPSHVSSMEEHNVPMI